jgi:hypothetical protein
MAFQDWSEKQSTHAQGYFKDLKLVDSMKASRDKYKKQQRILKAARQLLKASSERLDT